jgi:hypothetical protein
MLFSRKRWTPLNFGKHNGKTLPQVVFADPDWFFWAHEKGVFENRGRLRREANEIYQRATSIKVPQEDDEEKWVAEYGMHKGRFCNVEVVPKSRERHHGSTTTFRRTVFDLSFPRQISSYDKGGCRLLVRSLKFYLFGDEHCRLTKQRCEEFFDDDSNFVL